MDIKEVKFLFYMVLLMSLSTVLFSTNTRIGSLRDNINTFTGCIYSLLPPIAMLLVIAAAVTFAAGQLASAETRARATSWATAMVVGALFAFVLVAIFPSLINILFNGNMDPSTIQCIL